MNVKKFWSRGTNYVHTRERGVIPGCLPACDVHLSIPMEDMQRATGERADTWASMMNDLVEGRMKWRDFMAHKYHTTDVKLSAIGNPSVSYRKDW